MFAGSVFSQRMEKPEGRLAVHIPMVYEKVTPEPMRWEYYVLAIDTYKQSLVDAERLNKLGREGWILAGILDEKERGSLVHYYFVRQVAE
ncbi:MAG: hypothetical protein JO202_05195 [Ktedonobacteraceae bacterium]|nr:hypothetical protein [Ktedonobacteraceae bacterium]